MTGTRKKTLQKWKVFVDSYVLTSSAAESARAAGYTGKNVGVTACGLLKKPEIQQMIAKLQKSVIETPVAITPAVVERLKHEEQIVAKRAIKIEDKRALLWDVACHQGRVMREEDICEEVDDEGHTTRIITRTERIFDGQGCVNAILAMSQIDGDMKAPGAAAAGGVSIENLLLSIGR